MSESNYPTWPENEADATADRMIACAAAATLDLQAETDPLYHAVPWGDKESTERGPAIRRWARAIAHAVSRGQFAALLVAMQEKSPEAADEAARLIWSMTEDGSWLFEIAFDYLNDRGYDAQAIWASAEQDVADVEIRRQGND